MLFVLASSVGREGSPKTQHALQTGTERNALQLASCRYLLRPVVAEVFLLGVLVSDPKKSVWGEYASSGLDHSSKFKTNAVEAVASLCERGVDVPQKALTCPEAANTCMMRLFN